MNTKKKRKKKKVKWIRIVMRQREGKQGRKWKNSVTHIRIEKGNKKKV